MSAPRRERFRRRRGGPTHDIEIGESERRVLLDAKEVARERVTGLIDDHYTMVASMDDFRAWRETLGECGLIDADGAITVAGMLALEASS